MNRARCLSFIVHLAAVVEVSACTLLSEFDVGQCEHSTDCITAAGALGRCERSRCVTSDCSSNGECIAADPRFPICQRPGGDCVALLTAGPECAASSDYDPVTMDGLTADELVLLGAFAPSIRTSTGLSVQLAVRELNANGGLPGASGSRPVLVVECDGNMAPEAMHHLVDELGVQAILGSLDAADLRSIVTQGSTREEAFFLSPGDAYHRPLTPSAGGEYLWYLGAAYDDIVPAYAALTSAIVDVVAAAPGQAAPVTIASITSTRDEDEALHQAVYDSLLADARTGPMLAAEGGFLFFTLPDDAGDGWRAMLDLLVQRAPDVVISFAGGVFGSPARRERASVFRALEGLAMGTGYAPRYVLGPSNVEDAALARLARDDASFRSRALLLRARRPRDPVLRDALNARFEAAYPDAASYGLHVSPAVYDGIYFLAYAVAAAPATAGRGHAERTREGLGRIADAAGPDVGVGPDGLAGAIDYLSRGVPFNLRGTDGIADFDPSEQARPGQGKLYCWDETGAPREVATHYPEAGFILEATPCGPEVADVVAASNETR